MKFVFLCKYGKRLGFLGAPCLSLLFRERFVVCLDVETGVPLAPPLSCPPCVMPSGNPNTQGLTAVISVKVPEPEFEGQTKNRLGNPEVRGIVDQVVNEELIKVFEWHPKVSQFGGAGWLGRGGRGVGGSGEGSKQLKLVRRQQQFIYFPCLRL